MSFTGNEGPAVNLLWALASCAPGLPTNYFPSCTSACYQQWNPPARTTTCIPELLTTSPTRAPTSAPTAVTAPPTRAPTVTPEFPTCTYGSPFSDVFAQVDTISVTDSATFRAALNGANGQPIVITLAQPGTYVMDKAYTVNSNVCIEVSDIKRCGIELS